jgi:hypothetical protein
MSPRSGLARPVVGPRPAPTTPATLRALSITPPAEERSPSGMNNERRKVEKIRRDAVRKRFGR